MPDEGFPAVNTVLPSIVLDIKSLLWHRYQPFHRLGVRVNCARQSKNARNNDSSKSSNSSEQRRWAPHGCRFWRISLAGKAISNGDPLLTTILLVLILVVTVMESIDLIVQPTQALRWILIIAAVDGSGTGVIGC